MDEGTTLMNYVFDLDGTICTQEANYRNALPNASAIARINQLYAQGHRIEIWTARGASSGQDWKELTRGQLKEWGVSYHQLSFGKPAADIYIDDKAVNVKDWMKGLSI